MFKVNVKTCYTALHQCHYTYKARYTIHGVHLHSVTLTSIIYTCIHVLDVIYFQLHYATHHTAVSIDQCY